MTIPFPPARKALAVLTALTMTGSSADRTSTNLKAFRTVCVNGRFPEQDTENDAVRTTLLQREYSALDAADSLDGLLDGFIRDWQGVH